MATLQQVKTHLNIDNSDTTHDVELQMFLEAAEEWVATKVADTTPKPVQLAILFLVAHLWDPQRGPVAAPLDDVNQPIAAGFGFAIPNRVRELLDPYMTAASTPRYSFPDARCYPDPIERN